MNLLKSLFITGYLMAGVAGLIAALLALADSRLHSPWLGTAIACAGPTLFFSQIMLKPRARTSRNLNLLIAAGVVGAGISVALAGSLAATPVLISLAVGVAGSLVYVFWYSRFGAAGNAALSGGAQLPDFELVEQGRRFRTAELVAKPALWIFYRGNWCPLCVAQIQEIAAQYRELARRGVEVYLVSPQPEANSQALSKKMDAPMRFMTDADNRAAETLGIKVVDGLPAGFQALGYGSDVPRPTVFITEPGGRLIFCDLTDNYRVRPEPATFFSVLDRHAIV
ncbi:redoxin domain-containing protein [Nevskia sp.]|uniref:redoxin domain-containing protein n=1 Tax=Nevskia sp. TaxID=1929292 RepID=UPI0025F30B63|nr:redoxin domain-containing protein [Nevskia sp.]